MTPELDVTPALPHVIVLLATHNAAGWLPEQWASIVSQRGVALSIVVSDDASTDGTYEWLAAQAAADERVTLLPRADTVRGAAPNFYLLLDRLDVGADDLIALADQDDLWLPGKLAAQAEIVGSGRADGVSSNVTAFRADGHRALVRKAFPQRRFDYVCESPGPGCTFVLSPRLVREVQQVLRDPSGLAARMEFHDWLIYGVCRARGWPWLIETTPWVDYRQHDTNAFGANHGLRSALRRIGLTRAHWHRREALVMVDVARQVAPVADREDLERLHVMLAGTGWRQRAVLVRRAGDLRRRPRDRAALAALVSLGLW